MDSILSHLPLQLLAAFHALPTSPPAIPVIVGEARKDFCKTKAETFATAERQPLFVPWSATRPRSSHPETTQNNCLCPIRLESQPCTCALGQAFCKVLFSLSLGPPEPVMRDDQKHD